MGLPMPNAAPALTLTRKVTLEGLRVSLHNRPRAAKQAPTTEPIKEAL